MTSRDCIVFVTSPLNASPSQFASRESYTPDMVEGMRGVKDNDYIVKVANKAYSILLVCFFVSHIKRNN
jgi:hypothetical protein